MKDFMLIYKGGDPDWMKNSSQEEMAESMARWGAWMGALQEKDQLGTGGSPLQFSGKRVNEEGVVTDILASEFKELVTGYNLIKATDIDEAITIAKECPIFSYPNITVEVREIMNIDCS